MSGVGTTFVDYAAYPPEPGRREEAPRAVAARERLSVIAAQWRLTPCPLLAGTNEERVREEQRYGGYRWE